jgi:hypothetical protein
LFDSSVGSILVSVNSVLRSVICCITFLARSVLGYVDWICFFCFGVLFLIVGGLCWYDGYAEC